MSYYVLIAYFIILEPQLASKTHIKSNLVNKDLVT